MSIMMHVVTTIYFNIQYKITIKGPFGIAGDGNSRGRGGWKE